MARKTETLHGISRAQVEEAIQGANLSPPNCCGIGGIHDSDEGKQWEGAITVVYEEDHPGAVALVESLKKRSRPRGPERPERPTRPPRPEG